MSGNMYSTIVLGGTAVPFFHGTSTVEFTVLFGTAIPQVPRFCCTILAHNYLNNQVNAPFSQP